MKLEARAQLRHKKIRLQTLVEINDTIDKIDMLLSSTDVGSELNQVHKFTIGHPDKTTTISSELSHPELNQGKTNTISSELSSTSRLIDSKLKLVKKITRISSEYTSLLHLVSKEKHHPFVKMKANVSLR